MSDPSRRARAQDADPLRARASSLRRLLLDGPNAPLMARRICPSPDLEVDALIHTAMKAEVAAAVAAERERLEATLAQVRAEATFWQEQAGRHVSVLQQAGRVLDLATADIPSLAGGFLIEQVQRLQATARSAEQRVQAAIKEREYHASMRDDAEAKVAQVRAALEQASRRAHAEHYDRFHFSAAHSRQWERCQDAICVADRALLTPGEEP